MCLTGARFNANPRDANSELSIFSQKIGETVADSSACRNVRDEYMYCIHFYTLVHTHTQAA